MALELKNGAKKWVIGAVTTIGIAFLSWMATEIHANITESIAANKAKIEGFETRMMICEDVVLEQHVIDSASAVALKKLGSADSLKTLRLQSIERKLDVIIDRMERP